MQGQSSELQNSSRSGHEDLPVFRGVIHRTWMLDSSSLSDVRLKTEYLHHCPYRSSLPKACGPCGVSLRSKNTSLNQSKHDSEASSGPRNSSTGEFYTVTLFRNPLTRRVTPPCCTYTVHRLPGLRSCAHVLGTHGVRNPILFAELRSIYIFSSVA